MVGGGGFAADPAANEVVFRQNNRERKGNHPSAVKGDALIGVAIPADIAPGTVEFSVRVTFQSKTSELSSWATLTVKERPTITSIDPKRGRPGSTFNIHGSGFASSYDGPMATKWNSVFFTTYNEGRSFLLEVVTADTDLLVVKLPESSERDLIFGNHDVKVSVGGSPFSNSTVFDLILAK